MNSNTFMKDYWEAWEKRDWDVVGGILTDDFTFTSPKDDHIRKQIFKRECWDTLSSIEVLELKVIAEHGNEVYVRYRLKVDGELIHNIEHFVFREDKIASITVFFGHTNS